MCGREISLLKGLGYNSGLYTYLISRLKLKVKATRIKINLKLNWWKQSFKFSVLTHPIVYSIFRNIEVALLYYDVVDVKNLFINPLIDIVLGKSITYYFSHFITIFTLCMWFPHIAIDFVFVPDMVIFYFLAIRFKWCAIVCKSSSDVAIKIWSSA